MKKIFLLLLLLPLFTGCMDTDFLIIDANTTEILENITIYPNITTTQYDNSTGEYLLTQINSTYYRNNSNRSDIITLEYNATGFAENITVANIFGNTTMFISYNERGDIENVTYQRN